MYPGKKMSINSNKNTLPAKPKLRKKRHRRSNQISLFPDDFGAKSFGSEMQVPTSSDEEDLSRLTNLSSAKQINRTQENLDSHHFSQYYVNPTADALRRGLIAKMKCTWCFKFFDAENDPRILFHSFTRCCECLAKFYNITPAYVKKMCPLNEMLARSIQRTIKLLHLFSYDLHAYSELERSIFHNNICRAGIEGHKNIQSNLLRTSVYLDDIRQSSLNSFCKHQEAIDTIIIAINVIENCKKQLLNFSFHSKIQSCYSKIKNLQTCELLKQDEIEWIRLIKYFDLRLPAKYLIDRFKCVEKETVQWFGFFDANGSRRYCEFSYDLDTMCISSFSRKFPKFSSSFIIAEFYYVDPILLSYFSMVYFDICRQSIMGRYEESRRFYITIAKPTSLMSVVHRFLGIQQPCYLDADIEVTDELLIFGSYLQNGMFVENDELSPSTHLDNSESTNIKPGMVVSEIKGQSKKLTIFKFNSGDQVGSLFGVLTKSSVETLLTIPNGRYKIIACGIGKTFDFK